MKNNDRNKGFLTGATGVYAVAKELSAQGYIVTITARNAPGVDIIATTQDLSRAFNVQVKANRPGGTHSFWLLNKDASGLISPNFFYVFVNFKKDYEPEFYVVESQVVARDMEVSRSPKSEWFSFPREEKFKNNWTILTRGK